MEGLTGVASLAARWRSVHSGRESRPGGTIGTCQNLWKVLSRKEAFVAKPTRPGKYDGEIANGGKSMWIWIGGVWEALATESVLPPLQTESVLAFETESVLGDWIQVPHEDLERGRQDEEPAATMSDITEESGRE